MTAAALSIASPFQTFTGTNGQPLNDGRIYVGTVGLNPRTNPVQVYFDADMTIPAAQPIRTINGYPSRDGSPATVYISDGDCSVLVTDRAGSLVFSALSIAQRVSASQVMYTPPGAGVVTRNISDEIDALDVDVARYGAATGGVVDNVAAFQSALAVLATNGGGRLTVKSGEYWFDVSGDSDSLVIPSNVEVRCEFGTVFSWDYWGSPLIAVVNKENVKIKNIKFKWGGTFGTTSGSRDGFGWGTTTASYEWCAHIVGFGTDNLELENISCEGETTANIQNACISLNGKSTGAKSNGLRITNVTFNDVCQGVVGGNQNEFVVDNVFSGRYSNASNALYGPGHVIYATDGWENGFIGNINDSGTKISAYTTGAHTLSLKDSSDFTVSNIYSLRDEGSVNRKNLSRVIFDGIYDLCAVRSVDTSVACFHETQPSVNTSGNTYRNITVVCNAANRSLIATPTSGLVTTRYSGDVWENIRIRHAPDSGYSATIFSIVGNGTRLDGYTYENNGSAVKESLATYGNNISAEVNYSGVLKTPRIGISSAHTGTRVKIDSPAGSLYHNNTVPAGNYLENEQKSLAQSVSLGTVTSPAPTIQLPSPGAYLVHVVVSNRVNDNYGNHAFGGLYQVVWDNANSVDFNIAQLIGTQISKGTNITALSVSVNSSGLITVTTTTNNNAWYIDYSWTYLHA